MLKVASVYIYFNLYFYSYLFHLFPSLLFYIYINIIGKENYFLLV